jgi:hypothetical protein
MFETKKSVPQYPTDRQGAGDLITRHCRLSLGSACRCSGDEGDKWDDMDVCLQYGGAKSSMSLPGGAPAGGGASGSSHNQCSHIQGMVGSLRRIRRQLLGEGGGILDGPGAQSALLACGWHEWAPEGERREVVEIPDVVCEWGGDWVWCAWDGGVDVVLW